MTMSSSFFSNEDPNEPSQVCEQRQAFWLRRQAEVRKFMVPLNLVNLYFQVVRIA